MYELLHSLYNAHSNITLLCIDQIQLALFRYLNTLGHRLRNPLPPRKICTITVLRSDGSKDEKERVNWHHDMRTRSATHRRQSIWDRLSRSTTQLSYTSNYSKNRDASRKPIRVSYQRCLHGFYVSNFGEPLFSIMPQTVHRTDPKYSYTRLSLIYISYNHN